VAVNRPPVPSSCLPQPQRLKSVAEFPGPHIQPPDDDADLDADGEADAAELRPSRSARKRHAEGLQRLGVRLTQLRAVQLHALNLPAPLLEAVLETQRLRSRAALARARQYIGRLMRDLDPQPIEQALAALLPPAPAGPRRARRPKPGRVP